MERAIALKKLGNLLGNKLCYRVNSKAPTSEEREAAKIELAACLPTKTKLKEQMEARYRQILADDAEYQRLSAEYKAARERSDKLWGITHRHKFTVGVSNGMFFAVKAEGDSWEEVIGKIETENRRAA